MPESVFLVPWRGGDHHREASWDLVRPYYQATEIPMFLGTSDPGPFSVAQAYNRAAAAATKAVPDWDIAIAINTDCVIPLENLLAGIDHARRTGHLTLPHDDYRALKKGAFPEPPIADEVWWKLRLPWIKRAMPAGVVIIPRPIWDRLGGYDERFVSWGYEDSALLVATGEFDRMSGPLFHYWHPKRTDIRNEDAYRTWRDEYWGRQPKETLVTPEPTGIIAP